MFDVYFFELKHTSVYLEEDIEHNAEFPIQMERFSSGVDQEIGTKFEAKRRIKTLWPALPHVTVSSKPV